MSKESVIKAYIKGAITISEARKMLNIVEGRRLVDLIDKRNEQNK